MSVIRVIGYPAAVGGLVTTAVASAQVPAVPAAPPVPAAPVPAAAVPAVPAAPPARNLWSFFMLTPEQRAAKEAKKAKFCRSPFGQLLNNMTKPLALASGGLIGGGLCCPPDATDPLAPSPEDLNKPPTDAEGAAARIKKLEIEAGERKEAVKYLGTVNCRRFPEAEAALVNALRTDTNECVRYEAALALTRGCCCTKKTVAALTLTVNGGTDDGNPPETSARVRAAAAAALARCCGAAAEATPPEPPAEPPPPEGPPPAGRSGGAAPDTMAAARRALEDYSVTQAVRPRLVTGHRSIADAVRIAATAPVVVSETPLMPAAVPTPMPATVPTAAPAEVPAEFTVPSVMPAQPPAVAPAPVPPTGKRNLLDIIKASIKK